MKPITEKQKELLRLMVNEWMFKESILSYTESQFMRKFFKQSLTDGATYDDISGKLMNEIRVKWINYHNGKYDSTLPIGTIKQANYSKKLKKS